MKRLIYCACLIGIAVITILEIVLFIWTVIEVMPVYEQLSSEGVPFIDAALSIGMTIHLLQWAIIVVPLALIAMLTRPGPPPPRRERIEPHLERRP